ncbi:MAG: hypothetical protein N3A02_03580 [Rectinema sp.]|nr:hypothetical protein [Rectinema sp.]
MDGPLFEFVFLVARWTIYVFTAILGIVLIASTILLCYWGFLKIAVRALQDRRSAMAAMNAIAAEKAKLQTERDRLQQERLEAERGLIEAQRKVEEAKDQFRRWRLDADVAFDLAKQEAEKRQLSVLQELSQRMQTMDEALERVREEMRQAHAQEVESLRRQVQELEKQLEAAARAREERQTRSSQAGHDTALLMQRLEHVLHAVQHMRSDLHNLERMVLQRPSVSVDGEGDGESLRGSLTVPQQ